MIPPDWELSPRLSIPALDANILFWVLNIFGALDAKRMGEGLVRRARGELGVITCIVRLVHEHRAVRGLAQIDT